MSLSAGGKALTWQNPDPPSPCRAAHKSPVKGNALIHFKLTEWWSDKWAHLHEMCEMSRGTCSQNVARMRDEIFWSAECFLWSPKCDKTRFGFIFAFLTSSWFGDVPPCSNTGRNTHRLLRPLGERAQQTWWCHSHCSPGGARGLIDLWRTRSVCGMSPPWLTYLRKQSNRKKLSLPLFSKLWLSWAWSGYGKIAFLYNFLLW